MAIFAPLPIPKPASSARIEFLAFWVSMAHSGSVPPRASQVLWKSLRFTAMHARLANTSR